MTVLGERKMTSLYQKNDNFFIRKQEFDMVQIFNLKKILVHGFVSLKF